MSVKSFAKDRIGQVFGKLTVISQATSKEYFSKKENRKKKKAVWNCVCECGNSITVISNSLVTGNTVSCGCFKKETTTEFNRRTKTDFTLNSCINSLRLRYVNDAKKRNYSFDISFETFAKIIKKNCEYCGIEPYQVHVSHSGSKLVYNGIDRVDPSMGYSEDNIAPCCGRCNLMKLDMTRDEFIKICYRIVLKAKNNKNYLRVKDSRPSQKDRLSKRQQENLNKRLPR